MFTIQCLTKIVRPVWVPLLTDGNAPKKTRVSGIRVVPMEPRLVNKAVTEFPQTNLYARFIYKFVLSYPQNVYNFVTLSDGLDDWGSILGKRFFSTPQRPDRL
jgi:hypothetical protein